MYYKIKKVIYDTIVDEESKTLAQKIFYASIIALILINITLVSISTLEGISYGYLLFSLIFELIVVIIFTIEYALRLWACNIDKKFRGRFGRLRYAVQPMIIIDFLAIFPFWAILFTPIPNYYAILGRLLRLLRLFRFGFFKRALYFMAEAIRRKKWELIITIITVIVLVVFCAYIIYYAENRVQPEVYSSIPASLYWGFVTMSTVGYGDMTPITPFGRFFTALVSFLGIGIIAIPAGIISSGMTEVMRERKAARLAKKEGREPEEKRKCPHCGKPMDDG